MIKTDFGPTVGGKRYCFPMEMAEIKPLPAMLGQDIDQASLIKAQAFEQWNYRP